MIPGDIKPRARHSELVDWHRQIRSLRKSAPANASAGIDAKSRQVCVVMPQDYVSSKSVAHYDWTLLSRALGSMSAESREIARQLGLNEPALADLEPEELAACHLEFLEELVSAAVNTDSGQFVLLREAMNHQISIMLKDPNVNWDNVEQGQRKIMSDLQRTIGALQWHYRSELQHLSPRLEIFLIEWLEHVQRAVNRSRWPGGDKSELMTSLREHIAMTLDSVREHLSPLEAVQKSETSNLSFRQRLTYSSRSNAPFYMEPQELQTCGRHAGNAFLGGPLIKLPASDTPMGCEDVFAALKQVLSDPEKHKLFDQPMVICSYQALANDKLFHELNTLKHDRVLILADLNSHYLTFRRDKHGQWYKLESTKYEQHGQEQIKPGDYLKQRTFHGYHGQLQRKPMLGALQIICLAGENISGTKTDTTETQ